MRPVHPTHAAAAALLGCLVLVCPLGGTTALAAPVDKTPSGDLDQDDGVLLADLQCLILGFHRVQAAEPVVSDQCSSDGDCEPGEVCRPHFSGFDICLHGCLDAVVTAGPDPAIDCSGGADNTDCHAGVHRRSFDLDCDGDIGNVDIQFLVAMVLGAASGPGTPDVDSDGILNFCDEDSDGDGVPDGGDCAPLDPERYAGNDELCDGIDSDCDLLADDDDPDIEGGCAIGACDGLDCSTLSGACTTGVCDHVAGACAALPTGDGDPCDDGNACTSNDTCGAGLCAGAAVSCDDGDVCDGEETCDPLEGCVDGTPLDCVDDDLCDGTETCDPVAGCVDGTPLDCLDDDLCNGDETCDPATGCVDGTPLDCIDDDLCDGTETCDPVEGCQEGTPLTCDNDDVCDGDETCDPATGCVDGTPLNCVDEDLCDGTETCDPVAGCSEGAPLDCIDDDVCDGDETCDPTTGCVDGTPLDCVDEDLCDGTETCDPVAGCEEGTPLTCDNSDVCDGDETCDPATGCVDGTPLDCDDTDVCNGLETCDPTTGCVDGTPLDCADDDLCDGTEVCVTGLGCVDGDALVCDDGDPCNGTETCATATGCVDGTSIECPDIGACTLGACDPATGGCDLVNADDGSPCDDGQPCTALDTCTGGSCSGAALDPCPFTGTDVVCTVSGSTGDFGTCVIEMARGCEGVPAPVTAQLWFEWDSSAVEVIYFTDSTVDPSVLPPLPQLYQTYPAFEGSFEAPGFYPTCVTHPILTDLCLSYDHAWSFGPGSSYADWGGAMTIFVYSDGAPAPILDGVLTGAGETTGETVLFHLHYRFVADVDPTHPTPIVISDAVADDPDVVPLNPAFDDGILLLDYNPPICEPAEPGSGPATLCTLSGETGDIGTCTIEVVRGCDAVPPPTTTQLWFEWDPSEVEVLYFTDSTQDAGVLPPLPDLYQTYPSFDGSFEAPGFYPTCTPHPIIPDVCASYAHDYNSGPGADYSSWNGAMTLFVFSKEAPSPILDGVLVDGTPVGETVLFNLHYRLKSDVSAGSPASITLADVVADDADVAPFAPIFDSGRVVLDYGTPVCP